MLHRCGHGLAPPVKPSFRCRLPPNLRIRAKNTFRLYSNANPSPSSHDIAILGGGISGLASAYYLIRELPKARITIYEAADRLGGWVESKRVPVDDGSIVFESAVRSLRPAKNGVLTGQMIQELDLAKDTIFTQTTAPAARNRYVYYPDRLVRMPHPSYGLVDNVWSMLTEPVFETVAWSAITELSKPPRDAAIADESIGSFISRRASKTVADRLVSAVIHGIYAGDIWKLSAKSLLSRQYRDEIQTGGIFRGIVHSRANGVEMSQRDIQMVEEMRKFDWEPRLKSTLAQNSVFTFKDGVSMLTDRLAVHLLESGRVAFKTGTPVQSIAVTENKAGISVRAAGTEGPQNYTHVVSALPPAQLNLVAQGPTSPPSDRLVSQTPTVTVMVVNLYFKTPDMHEPGFGYLIPQATPFENNPERALGVVFDTAYSPSPADLDMKNWANLNVDTLKQMKEGDQLVNVNDFSWYNIPDKPNSQDHVQTRGTKVTVMLGGHWWDDWPAYPDEKEGLALARSLLERHLGIKEEPLAWQVNLQKDCIPQYTVGHERRLQEAHNKIWQKFKGKLRVAGNWTYGVGINDCLRSAYEVAKNFNRNATGLEHVGEELVRVALKPRRDQGNRNSE